MEIYRGARGTCGRVWCLKEHMRRVCLGNKHTETVFRSYTAPLCFKNKAASQRIIDKVNNTTEFGKRRKHVMRKRTFWAGRIHADGRTVYDEKYMAATIRHGVLGKVLIGNPVIAESMSRKERSTSRHANDVRTKFCTEIAYGTAGATGGTQHQNGLFV